MKLGPIDAIQGELEKLEAALCHRPLPSVRVAESLRRLDRIRAHLVKLDPMLREACKHDGVVSDGSCLGCGQDGLPTQRTSLIPPPPKMPSIPEPSSDPSDPSSP